MQRSNGKPETSMNEDFAAAYKATGDYVRWLRTNTDDLLAALEASPEHDERLVYHCSLLGDFTADMRARPDPPRKDGVKEELSTKELPSRLTKQYVRLAACLAVVMNRPSVDEDVLALVTKVACDTAKGKTLDLVRRVKDEGDHGADPMSLGVLMNEEAVKVRNLLLFLAKIDVVYLHVTPPRPGVKGGAGKKRWKLTERFAEIWEEVFGAG